MNYDLHLTTMNETQVNAGRMLFPRRFLPVPHVLLILLPDRSGVCYAVIQQADKFDFVIEYRCRVQ